MDQQTAAELADIRHQLGQLRSALGVLSPDEAESVVTQLRETVETLAADLTLYEANIAAAAQQAFGTSSLADAATVIAGLMEWAVVQGFTPPAS